MNQGGNSQRAPSRKEVFSYRQLRKDFEDELQELTVNVLEKRRAQFLPPENTLHYTHGSSWVQSTSTTDGEVNHFVRHQFEVLIKTADIIAHNFSVLPASVVPMVKGMMDGFQKLMYETVSKAADAVGNVVKTDKHGSPALAFLEMIRKVEFGVDRQGNPSRPQIHIGSEAMEKLVADVKARGKEFEALVQSAISEKEQAAAEKEQRRRKRFKGLQ